MLDDGAVAEMIEGYDIDNLILATVCSHSSLQIFNGARKEGFRTLGIAIKEAPRYYDAFPGGKPDEFLIVDDYGEIPERAEELREKGVIIIPHGSFVEYLGHENFRKLPVPTFGNRRVLEWESDREKERIWLMAGGLEMPQQIHDPRKIDRPVLVKYHGARGGRGFFIAKNYLEFKQGIEPGSAYNIQEYLIGTRYYLHYFYSPFENPDAYRIPSGSLQLMSIDRRDETNIDEMYKLGSQEELRKHNIFPSFVVTGNVPVVLRESLLSRVFEMGEGVVEASHRMIGGGGMIGSFCLETVVTDELKFKVFEISARIVAGTNPFVSGSPYSDLIEPGLSTGRRIAREIKRAIELDALMKILS